MDILSAVVVFFATLLVIEGGYFVFRRMRDPEINRVRKRLRTLSFRENQTEDITIIRKQLLSEVPWFNRLLLRIRWSDKVNRLLEQSGTRYLAGFYILLTLLLAAFGFLIASLVASNLLISIVLAALLGAIPFLYLSLTKKRRMQKFERQLPEAMDMIARSLKAGHAFSGGLKMVADEFDDPLGTEFDKTVNEINFGVAVTDALKALSNRVDSPDVKYFVISVILQRETGGNLAQILENIARLIRERLKLYGHIRVLAAEGKLSAIILIALPFALALFIYLGNPTYIETLFGDPIGHIFLVVAALMMAMGIFVMKRMIAIKV
jgi:tight adherence protein B